MHSIPNKDFFSQRQSTVNGLWSKRSQRFWKINKIVSTDVSGVAIINVSNINKLRLVVNCQNFSTIEVIITTIGLITGSFWGTNWASFGEVRKLPVGKRAAQK